MSTIGPRELRRRTEAVNRWIARQIRDHRLEAGITQAGLATCAGVTQSMASKIDTGSASPSLELLVALSACLGSEVSVRLFPVSGPRIRDRFQAPMIEAFLHHLGPDWRAQPEVAVPAARGVIDLVLRRGLDQLNVACECHSELRRLELALRRASEKADALGAQLSARGMASSMLLLRSTRATRDVVRTFDATLRTAYPARMIDALAALAGSAAWPGPAIVWVKIEAGRATLLDTPPRGVRLGR